MNHKRARKNASLKCVIPLNISGKLVPERTLNSACTVNTDLQINSKLKKNISSTKATDISQLETNTVTHPQENMKTIKTKKYPLNKSTRLKEPCVNHASKRNLNKIINPNNNCTLLKTIAINNSINTLSSEVLKPSTNKFASKCSLVEKFCSTKTSENKVNKSSNPKISLKETQIKLQPKSLKNVEIYSTEINSNKTILKRDLKNKTDENKKRNKIVKVLRTDDLKELSKTPKCTVGEATSTKGINNDQNKHKFNDLNKVTVVSNDNHALNTNAESQVQSKQKSYKDRKGKLSKDKLDLKTTKTKHKKQPKSPKKKQNKTIKYRKIKLVINVICNNQQKTPTFNSNERSKSSKACTVSNVDLDFLNDFDVDEIVESLETCDKEISLETNYSPNIRSITNNNNEGVHETDTLDLIKILKGEEDVDLIEQPIENTKELLHGNNLHTFDGNSPININNIGKKDISKAQSSMHFKRKEENQILDITTEIKESVLTGDINDSQNLSTEINDSIQCNCKIYAQNIPTTKTCVKDSKDENVSVTIDKFQKKNSHSNVIHYDSKSPLQLDYNFSKPVEVLKQEISTSDNLKESLSYHEESMDYKNKNYMNGLKDNSTYQHIIKKEYKVKTENDLNGDIFSYLNDNTILLYNDQNIFDNSDGKKMDKLNMPITHKQHNVVYFDNISFRSTEDSNSFNGHKAYILDCGDRICLENNDYNNLEITEFNNGNVENNHKEFKGFVSRKQGNTLEPVTITQEKERQENYEKHQVKNSASKEKQTIYKYSQSQKDGDDECKKNKIGQLKKLSFEKYRNNINLDSFKKHKEKKNNKNYVPNLTKDISTSTQEIEKKNVIKNDKKVYTDNSRQFINSVLNQIKSNGTLIQNTRNSLEDKDQNNTEQISKNDIISNKLKLYQSSTKDKDEIHSKDLISPTYRDISSKFEETVALELEEIMSSYFGIKYYMTSIINKGKFSKVFKCKHPSGKNYALKMFNNNRTMDIKKKQMLYSLQNNIPLDNLYTVYLVNAFNLVDTWYILMEYYPKNLTQVLNEAEKSFSIDHVQDFTRQLVTAVFFLKNNCMVHLDIKPKHILINRSNNMLNLCGFDSLRYINNMKVLPNLGSVNYRAPEVILGFTPGFQIDVWSTALVLFEMAANKKLFPGKFNNDILFKQICTLGCVPYDMIKKSRFATKHFAGSTFIRRIGYKGNNVDIVKKFKKNSLLRDSIYDTYFKNWAHLSTTAQKITDMKKIDIFINMLQEMLVIHPDYRLSIEYVYGHPFIYEPFKYQEW